MIKTSIVILNWNGKQYLKQFLPSVIKYTDKRDTEIVVADNGSTDDSLDFLKSEFPDIKLIELKKNYGFAEGYNKALQQVEAEFYILLNSDVEVDENWEQALIDVLEKNPTVAAVMPKIRSFHEKENFEYAGAAGGFIDQYGYPFCRGRILDKIEKDEGQYDQLTEVFWATGACLAIRAELFHDLHGFDSFFFAHMEEIDLCWRLKNKGYKIMFTPESSVFHVGGGSLPNEHPYKLFLNFRNNLILLYKNLPGKNLVPILFSRMILDGIAAIKYLLSLKPIHFYVVLKAHFSFYKAIRKYREFRKVNQEYNKTYPTQVFKGSMIVSYYLKGKKKFNQLGL